MEEREAAAADALPLPLSRGRHSEASLPLDVAQFRRDFGRLQIVLILDALQKFVRTK